MLRIVSSGVAPLILCTLYMKTSCIAIPTACQAASTATTPFIVQPCLPPLQIMPVMLIAGSGRLITRASMAALQIKKNVFCSSSEMIFAAVFRHQIAGVGGLGTFQSCLAKGVVQLERLAA